MTRKEFLLSNVALAASSAFPAGAKELSSMLWIRRRTIDGFFKSGRMFCLTNRSNSQMLSTVFVSEEGRIAVVDGGTVDDAPALGELLRSLGGAVEHWFITHNHDDHYGALYGLMREGPEALPKIGAVHYSFPADEWFRKYEASCCAMSGNFRSELLRHRFWPHHMKAGESFDLGGLSVEVLNDFDPSITANACNNSSICLSVRMGGKSMLVTGDLGTEGSDRLVRDIPTKLPHDVVFMSHHGQFGATRAFYAAVRPKIAIWPTTEWLWNNDALLRAGRGSSPGSGTFLTNYVKCWLQEIGVREQYVCTGDLEFS